MATVCAYFLGICTHIDANGGYGQLDIEIPLDALDGIPAGQCRRTVLVDATQPSRLDGFNIDPHLPLLCIPAKYSAPPYIPGMTLLIPGLWQLNGVRLYVRKAAKALPASPEGTAIPSLGAQAAPDPLASLDTDLVNQGIGAAAFFDSFTGGLTGFTSESKIGAEVMIQVETAGETAELVVAPFNDLKNPVTIQLPADAPLIFSNTGIVFGAFDTDEDFLLHYRVSQSIPANVDVTKFVPPPNPDPIPHKEIVDRFLRFLFLAFSGGSGGVGCSNSTYP